MCKKSLYNEHNESLKDFSKLFNFNKSYPHLRLIPNRTETYTNDGIIYNELTGTFIGFDWEYRDEDFANCQFQSDGLGQCERKLAKPSIQLAIKCNRTETEIAIGWRSDWLAEKQENLNLATDSSEKQYGAVRYTKKFKIYVYYENMTEFKAMLNKAFSTGKFSSESF